MTKAQEVKMATNKQYAGRVRVVMILMLLILSQVKVVSAHQTGSDLQQQRPGCVVQARVDPRDYYPIEGPSVPTASQVKWEVVCFAEGEAAAQHLMNTLAGYHSECGFAIRIDPRDYYLIEGTGMSTGRYAVWQEVCTP